VLPSGDDVVARGDEPERAAPAAAGGHRPVVVWAVAATTAVVVVTIATALVGGVAGGWQPIGDQGVIALKSWDTFSAHPPLIGPPTTLSLAAGEAVSHPGPLQFWLLAPFVRLFGPQGVLIGTALLNLAWVVAIVAVAWRHAGRGFALLTAAFVAVLVSALGGQLLRDPYNPWTAVLPLVLCALLCWTAMSGVRWALPAAVAVASVAAQAHVSFLLPTGMLVLAAVAMAVGRAVRDRRRLGAGDGDWRRERTDLLWSLGASAVVGVICWIGPIVDQLTKTGNLGQLLQAGGSDSERIGWSSARFRLVEMLRWPPHWLDRPGTLDFSAQSGLDELTALVTIAALVGLCVWGYRTGEEKLARLVVVAGVALLASVYTTSLIVIEGAAYLNISNRLSWWASGMLAWLALAWGLVLVARRTTRAGFRWLGSPHLAPVVAIGAVVLAAALVPRTLDNVAVADDAQSGYFGPAVYLADAIADEPGNGPYVLDAGNFQLEDSVAPALIAALEARGVEVHVADRLLRRLGWHRHVTGAEIGTIFLDTLPEAPGAATVTAGGLEPLAVFDQRDPPDGYERYEGYRNAIFGTVAMPAAVVIIPSGQQAGNAPAT
jgi:hypothetical protein